MKKLFLLLSAWMVSDIAYGQNVAREDAPYVIGVQYNQEFVLGGYVRVREWELTGDKMALEDLGMNTYAALQLNVRRNFRKLHSSLTLTYDQYFMRGNATFDRDIVYNGTIINGRTGIDVSPTRYYRVSMLYSGLLASFDQLRFKYLAGLVLDHVVFYLDGEVRSYSPKNEVYERFGRQAFPYPVLGIAGQNPLGRRGSIHIEVLGTYIPSFKSLYSEGGSMHLQYSTVLVDLKYARRVSDFALAAGGKFRHMRLFQESREDTNDLHTLTAGPYLELIYHF